MLTVHTNIYDNCDVTENFPHNEMKLKENSFKTVFKMSCFSFISSCGPFSMGEPFDKHSSTYR